MPAFVRRSDLPFVFREHERRTLDSENHAIAGDVEIARGDLGGRAAHGGERRLVEQVCEVGSAHAGRCPREIVEVDVLSERESVRMHTENFETLTAIGERYVDVTVEATRTQQCCVEHVGSVGSAEDHDARRRSESVELGKQLVQCLFAFVVAAAHARATLSPHRIDLVDEDDARCRTPRIGEQVTYPGGADADVHLHEVRTGDREERDVGFACDSSGQERFAGARRADQQHTFREPCADRPVAFRVPEHVDDFTELCLHALGPGDVHERDRCRTIAGAVAEPGRRPGHRRLGGVGRSSTNQQGHRDQNDHQRGDDRSPLIGRVRRSRPEAELRGGGERTSFIGREGRGTGRAERGAVDEHPGDHACVVREDCGTDLTAGCTLHEGGPREGVVGRAADPREQDGAEHQRGGDNEQPDRRPALPPWDVSPPSSVRGGLETACGETLPQRPDRRSRGHRAR